MRIAPDVSADLQLVVVDVNNHGDLQLAFQTRVTAGRTDPVVSAEPSRRDES